MLVYLKLQDYMKTKSVEFAYIWRDVLLDHPELDSTFKNPTSNYGAMAANSIRNQESRKVHGNAQRGDRPFFLRLRRMSVLS